MEMQSKINELQDSLMQLQQQLKKQEHSKVPLYNDLYKYLNPDQDMNGLQVIPLDSSLFDHSWNWNFNMPDLPQVAPYEFHLDIPEIPGAPGMPYEFHQGNPGDWEMYRLQPQPFQHVQPFYFDMPEPPCRPEKKHKPGILKMLPFYDLFKS